MASSAMQTFLSTPELLEAMLLQCDMRSLLTSAQRVCMQWRELIATSPALQTHLYFRAAPEPAEDEQERGQSSSPPSSPPAAPTLNPLLAEVFPPFFARFRINTSEGFWGRSEIRKLPLARNPAPFMRRDATWRAMHVQQPPLGALGVAMPSDSYTIVYEQVVCMGDLYDHVLRILTNPGQQWRILWREGPNLEAHTTLLSEFNHTCTRDLLREVDVVLIRGSDPWRSVSVLPSDRDFMARFTHPNNLRSRDTELSRPARITGRPPRREMREL